MKIEHTPGPWLVRGPLGFASHIVAADGTQVACGYEYASDAGFANARLIAAAPEMYEALRAYEAFEEHRANCQECECRQECAPETCAACFPFADDARCKIRAVLAKLES